MTKPEKKPVILGGGNPSFPVWGRVVDDDIDDCDDCGGDGEVQTWAGGFVPCDGCDGTGKVDA